MQERKFTFKKSTSETNQKNDQQNSLNNNKPNIFHKKVDINSAINKNNDFNHNTNSLNSIKSSTQKTLNFNSPKSNILGFNTNSLKNNSPTITTNIKSTKPTQSKSGDQSSLLNYFSKDNNNNKQKPLQQQQQQVKQTEITFKTPTRILDSDNEEDDFLDDFKKKPVAKLFITHSNDKKPVAAIKPQINSQINNQVKQNTFEKISNKLSDEKKETNLDTVKKTSLPYDEYCQVCQIKYDTINKTSQNRKVTDACGHFICLSCLLKGKLCKKCHIDDSDDNAESSNKNTESVNYEMLHKESDENITTMSSLNKKNTPIKKTQAQNQQNLNGYLAGIEDEFFFDNCVDNEFDNNEDLENFNEKLKLNNQNSNNFAKKAEFNTEKLFELSAKLVKSSTKSVTKDSLPLKNIINQRNIKDLVYVDSDDDLIIEEDEVSLNLNFSKKSNDNKIKSATNHDNDDSIPPINDDDDDDDLDIDELDEEELFILNSNNYNKQKINNNNDNPLTKNISIPDLSSYQNVKWLFNDIKDCSPLYRGLDYPHTKDLFDSFRNLFGLKCFRPQQFEAVNAALLGHHCFVLMPTGGGKSLCYQLPAILTKGVTFIVSPLKSLIIDQVQKLNALNLPAAHLLSEANGKSSSESEYIYMDLSKKEPTLRLIYITPEKLNNSDKLNRILSSLYSRNMVARLVIDEAHCVSTWGHDFRPDYKQLGAIRNRLFPTVPMMLLTATATPRVRKDILLQMNLLCENVDDTSQAKQPKTILYHKNQLNNSNKQYCAFFIQSFNRTNLQYSVEYKTSNKAALDKILDIIKKKFQNKSGIVYCISRNECESVSKFLKQNGLKALAYHAGMTDKQRNEIQHKWTNNIDCKIVCATIAFGMGIDKADVRFVIHLGLPKSLEGYYQESGRAGRDGLISSCILFYNNQDRHKWLRLMKQEQASGGYNYEVFKVHLDNLYRMSQYCDNRTDCRRSQILEYFGEIFDRKKCIENKQTICDNCLAFTSNSFTLKDITQEAISIIKGVREIGNTDVTLLHLAEVLKGSMNVKVVEKQHNHLEMHGKLARYKRTDIERILRRLIFDSYLKEDVKIIQHTDTVASYIKVGAKASVLLNGQVKIEFDLRSSDKDSQNDDDTNAEDEDSNKASSSVKSNKLKQTTLNTKSNKNTVLSTKNAKFTNKIGDLSAQNRILLRCRNDLKALAKRICTEKCVKNVNSIFTSNMIKEMILNLPQTRDELLRITHFTEAIYLNYKGEEFLAILKHYSQQLDDLRLCEALDNPNQGKVTSIDVNEANDLFETEDKDGDDWLTSKQGTGNSNNNKRNAQNLSFNKKPTKKARNDDDTSSYFSKNSNTSYSQGSQSGFKSSNKKKFWKFKKNNNKFKFYKKS